VNTNPKTLLKFIRHCKIMTTGSTQIALCIIKSYLPTKNISIIIHTVLLCGKIRILTPLRSDSELHFIVNVWCAVWDVHLTGQFVLKVCLKGEIHLQFLHEEFQLLEDVFLNRQGCMCIQYDRDLPHFSVKFGTSGTIIPMGDGRGMAGTIG